MTEQRRIPLNTVKSLSKDKKAKETVPTVRFNLKLCESNDQKCPEFSYADLLRNYKKEHVKKNGEGNSEVEKDPFSIDDDSEVAEIARRFEEKYGPSKKKRHWEDYIDRGMGYDETDPFIDNDEAYDELVPSTLTTKHGGFYINRGDLDFKVLSDSDFEAPQEPRIRKRRRRIREGSERTAEIIKRRKKAAMAAAAVAAKEINNLAPAASNNGELKVEAKKRGRKPYPKLSSALNPLKKKSASLSPTVAEMIQQRKVQQQQSPSRELSPPKLEKPTQIYENGGDSPATKVSSPTQPAEEPPPPPLRLATAEDNVENVIESVVKAAGYGLDEASPTPTTDNDAGDDGLGRGALVIDEDQRPSELSLLPPKLPDGLEPDLEDLINLLKEAARKSQEGKCKFFNSDVNRMLLQIEMKSKELSCTSRSVVFAHLAAFLPCTKETLLKRAKKLRLDQEDGKLKTPLLKLKEAITRAMPPLLEKYELECRHFAQEHKENEESKPTNTPDTTSNEGTTVEDAKLAPRKKFEWTPEIRQLLCDVVKAKLRCFEVAKSRMQSPEEYLRHFLDTEVRPLWPQGWMKTGTLFKESKSGHGHLTNKPKKTLVANNRKSSLKPTDSGGEGSKPLPTPLSTGSPAALNPEQIEIIPLPPLDAKELESKSPPEVKQPPIQEPAKACEPIQPKKELTPATPPPPVPQSLAMSKNHEKLSGEALFNKLVSASLEVTMHSFSKLPDASRQNPANINKVTLNEVTTKPSLDPVALAKSVAATTSIQRSESPNKRTFSTFGTSSDLSLQNPSTPVGRPQSSGSGAGNSLLDQIISASLANYPNSRSSSTPETTKPEIQIMDAASGKTIPPKSLSILSTKSCENKPTLSLLKSSYSPVDQSSHGKTNIPTIAKTLTVTSYTTVPVPKKGVEDIKLPHHSYGFNEAFKKSLQQTPVMSPCNEAPKVAVTYATRDVSSTRELVVSTTDYGGDEYSKFRKAQKHISASKQEYKKPHLFPEGMKGFPLPIKQEVPPPSYSPTLAHKSPSPSRASPGGFQYPASSDSRPQSSSSPWRGGAPSPGYTSPSSLYQQQSPPFRTSSSSTTHPHIVTAHRSADPPNRTEPSHRTEPASHHKPVEKYSPSIPSYSALAHPNELLSHKSDPSPSSHFNKMTDAALYRHLSRSSDLFSNKLPPEYSNKLQAAAPSRPSSDHLYHHPSSKASLYHTKDMYGLPPRQDGYSANLRQPPSSTSSYSWTYSSCDSKYPPQGSQPPH